MARSQGRRAGEQRGSSSVSQVHVTPTSTISEVPVPGDVPRFEIPAWRERYGAVAGITGRGSEPGRGFDLGLWSREPVGEVMSRWLAFRRSSSDFTAVVLGNQVHGTNVRRIDPTEGWTQVEGIDGWVTSTPGVLLTVTVADCVPVYLLVPGQAVALLHAGWRGTAGGILEQGLGALLETSRSNPANVVMHCGVAICGQCYEVGSEVMTGCGVPVDGPGPWYLDLRSVLTDQAQRLGVATISTSAWCSAHDRSSFYSHRASGGRDGRMVAYAGLVG
jgi:YfiH family protein